MRGPKGHKWFTAAELRMLLQKKDGTWYVNDPIRELLREAWEASLAEDKGCDPKAGRERARTVVEADIARTARYYEGQARAQKQEEEERLLEAAIAEADREREAQRLEKRKRIEEAVASRRKELAIVRPTLINSFKEEGQVMTAQAKPLSATSLKDLEWAVQNIRAHQRKSGKGVGKGERKKWSNEDEEIEARRLRLTEAFERVLMEKAPTSTEEELDFLYALHNYLQDKNALHEWEEGQTLQLVREDALDISRLTTTHWKRA